MPHENFLRNVEHYYNGKLRLHGPIAEGVDWKNEESQALRFEQLLRICPSDTQFSLNDYGCGYGALVDYLKFRNLPAVYHGFDISEDMIMAAREIHQDNDRCDFRGPGEALPPAHYSVASGIFNVKLDANRDEWERYVLDTLCTLDALSTKGFAFNCLTSYSDPERMRADLYYGDPRFFFDFSKRNFSRNVALLHDYGLYEWTILVRK